MPPFFAMFCGTHISLVYDSGKWSVGVRPKLDERIILFEQILI